MEINAEDALLDYVEFHISSPNNYYDVFICCHGVEERIGRTPVDQLSANLPEEGGCHAKFKIHLPEDIECGSWFSKATVLRFLKITESQDALNTIVAFANEMSQLEETRKFHVSLYGQAKNVAISSEDTKNELLRAMDSRLAALREELTTAFNRVAGEACSQIEIENLDKFCDHLGCTSLRNTLSKLSESSRNIIVNSTLDQSKTQITRGSQLNLNDSIQTSRPLIKDLPVEYDASPAKANHIEEHQSSTERNDNSSNYASEEEDGGASIERSRTRTRSATTPRRSASPMRRIQIGKSGSRRTPAIAVKSLSYFPGRERGFSSKDTPQNDDGHEESGFEQVPVSNVRRMSVQDAISLFERKQRDQTTDIQRKTQQIDNPPLKSVVQRRWSSGMGEPSNAKLGDQRIPNIKVEESDNRLVEEEQDTLDVATGVQSETCPDVSSLPESGRGVETVTELKRDDDCDFLPLDHTNRKNVVGENERMDSVEWNRQKEEELKQLLMSFALTQPKSKDQKIDKPNHELSGMGKAEEALYDQKKNTRNQRLQVEKAETKMVRQALKKTTEKQAPSREERKSIGKTTTKLNLSSPTNGGDLKKKQVASRTIQNEKTPERLPLSSNVKREPARTHVAHNPPPNKSSAMRKSWSSTPSSGGNGKIVAAKTSPPGMTTASGGSKSLRHKSQSSAASLTNSTPRVVENLKPHRKEARIPQVVDNSNRSKTVNGGASPQVRPKSVRSVKQDVLSVTEEKASKLKQGLRSEVTKKSSVVVPLESKSYKETQKIHSASAAKSHTPAKLIGSSPVKKPLSKSPTSVKEKEPLTRNETPLIDEDEVTISSAFEPTDQKVEGKPEAYETNHVDLESEAPVAPFIACRDLEEIPSETTPENDQEDSTERKTGSSANHEEVPIISPTVWVVENGEQDIETLSNSKSASQVDSSNHDDEAGFRVRHSLSQMLLLEEMSEPDDTAEWGQAENPPISVQKEAPKGLKKLLTFGRKNKGEANVADWSSSSGPHTFEGENAGENGKGFVRSNRSNVSFQSSSSVTSKASRSLFSLSAFRGTKATDSKIH